MTPSTPREAATVADLVLDEQATAESPRPSDSALNDWHDRLGTAGRAWLRRQIVTRLRELLDEPLADALLDIWAARGRIAEAARTTADDPDAERLVEVARQQATMDQEFTISIIHDDIWRTDFRGKATVTFDVATIEAVIRGGCLARVSVGQCRASGALELEGNLIASRAVAVPVVVEIDFDSPINLVRREGARAAIAAGS